jgi:hypothetical protein
MAAETGGADPLEQLREQLDRTRAAARALAREAAEVRATAAGSPGGEAAGGGADRRPPPAGWQAPGGDQPGRDAVAVLALAEAVRDLLPAELLERVVGLLRELMLAVRALLDYVVARLESRPVPAPEVQDIPVT